MIKALPKKEETVRPGIHLGVCIMPSGESGKAIDDRVSLPFDSTDSAHLPDDRNSHQAIYVYDMMIGRSKLCKVVLALHPCTDDGTSKFLRKLLRKPLTTIKDDLGRAWS